MNASSFDRPDVTIVTATKNRLRLLCETIDSVHAQTLESWEHIVVDDGSDDGTVEEVRRRSERDPRLRLIRRGGDRAGANVCRNLGIEQSRAEFVVFLDSDDVLRPQCLERRVRIMRKNDDLDFAVFRAGIFRATVGDLPTLYHAQMPGDDLLRFLSHECVWEITGPIWRRAFLQRIGRFDETLLSMQDLEMHVRAICARGKYIAFPDVDHDIRGQDDATKTSMRHFSDPQYIAASDTVRKKLLQAVSAAGLLTWSRKRALLGLCFNTAELWARTGHLSEALATWSAGCVDLEASTAVHLSGRSMLTILRFTRDPGSLRGRVVNRWKGFVRFRQEPQLLRGDAANIANGTCPEGC